MTGKTKNRLLVASCLIAIILCYSFAFSKTIKLKTSFDNLTMEESFYDDSPKTLSILKQKERHYDSIFAKYKLNGGAIQNTLLKIINSFAAENDLKVISFLEPHIFIDLDFTIKTYQFSLEGDYNGIIQLIHKLEQETKFGEVINVHFEKKKNFRSGRDYLVATVILKSIG